MTLAVWPRSVFVVPLYYTHRTEATPNQYPDQDFSATQLRSSVSCTAPLLPSLTHPAPGATPPRVHVWRGRSRVAGEWASGRRNRSPGARSALALAPAPAHPAGAGAREHVHAGAPGHATGPRLNRGPVRSGGWVQERSCAPTRYSGLSVTHTACAGENAQACPGRPEILLSDHETKIRKRFLISKVVGQSYCPTPLGRKFLKLDLVTIRHSLSYIKVRKMRNFTRA